jgi:hypothetical protein
LVAVHVQVGGGHAVFEFFDSKSWKVSLPVLNRDVDDENAMNEFGHEERSPIILGHVEECVDLKSEKLRECFIVTNYLHTENDKFQKK